MIGKKLSEIRKRKGYTISKLAKMTNISKSYLSNIERNLNNNPSLEVMKKIAAVLDVELLTLLEADKMVEPDKFLEKEWVDFVKELKDLGIDKSHLSQYKTLIEFIRWQNNQSNS